MKTTKEKRDTYRSLFAESQSPLASFVKQMIDDIEAAEAEVERLRAYVELQPCFCQRGSVSLCDRCKALGKEKS